MKLNFFNCKKNTSKSILLDDNKDAAVKCYHRVLSLNSIVFSAQANVLGN